MNKKKSIVLATAIATVFLIAMVGSASAADCGAGTAKPVCECGDTVKGDFTFTGNLVCSDETMNGLTIGADNIIIDGAGYKITGDVANATCSGGETAPCVTHSGVVNNAGWANIVVKDLEIEKFCTGVVIGTGTTAVENMTVTKCIIHDCGESTSVTHGIHLVASNNCTISQNEIYNQNGSADMGDCGSGGNGITMYGGAAAGNYGNHNTITCNYLHDNAKCGLHAKKCCMYNTISYNNASSNHGAGIMPECKKSDWNTIEYNTMLGNDYHGFYTCGNHNTIRYNTIKDSGYGDPWGSSNGIKIGAGVKPPPYGQYNDVYNNSACGTDGTDVWITQDQYGKTNSVDKNTCNTSNNASYCNDYSCANVVSVYYDFDKDNHYSKDLADCSCGIVGSKGTCACCNPGLFNSSHANMLNASRICWLTAGDDVNDCDSSITGEEISYYCDVDSDGYISASVSGTGTEIPPGCQATPGNDCDDTNPNVNPGATENCTNGIDDDCDGLIDMADPDCVAPGEEVTVNATVAVAAPEVVCKCEGPDDDPVKPGTQVEPNLWPDTKTVMKCAIVCDPNSIGDIKYVNATTYYPNTTIKETQTMHVANESEKAACCCDTTGLPNETCQVYAGYITMEACDPAGNYTVTVTATDNSGATGELSNTFEYLSIIGLDLDLNAVGFGTIVPGETKVVPGDGVWGAPNLTVHSIGNDPVDIEVSATDMTSDGNTITKDNIGCEIDALGSQWLNAPKTFSINLECCSYENVNLSLHVPEGTAQGAYTGKVTFVAKHA